MGKRTGGRFTITGVSVSFVTGIRRVMTQASVPCRPLKTCCFSCMLFMTEVKWLLRSIRLVVLCVILALCRFTVTLTRVVLSVGVLPMLLLATVMTRFLVPTVLISVSPRLGRMWVQISVVWICLCRVLGLSWVRLGLARMFVVALTFVVEVTVSVAVGQLLATTIMLTFVRWVCVIVVGMLLCRGLLKVRRLLKVNVSLLGCWVVLAKGIWMSVIVRMCNFRVVTWLIVGLSRVTSLVGRW